MRTIYGIIYESYCSECMPILFSFISFQFTQRQDNWISGLTIQYQPPRIFVSIAYIHI